MSQANSFSIRSIPSLEELEPRLLLDGIPPEILDVLPLPPDAGSVTAAIDVLTVQVSEDLQASGVNNSNTWALLGAGSDGILDTLDDFEYGISVNPAYVSGTDIRLTLSVSPLPLQEGLYRFTALASGLVDLDDGLAMTADHVRTFTVTAPTGVVIESTDNDTLLTATPLELVENPANSGNIMGRGFGTINPATYATEWSDPDYWSFEAQAGDMVAVAVDATDGSPVDPVVELRNDADGVLSSDNSGGPGGNAYISAYTIPTSGTYYVRVGKEWGSTAIGEYHLRVDIGRGIYLETDSGYANDALSGADRLALDYIGGHLVATVGGTLMANEGGNVDEDTFWWWQFNAGTTVELNLSYPSTSTLNATVQLLDSTGAAVTDTDPAADRFVAVMPANGVYYARVSSLSGAGMLGQYLLDIDVLDTVPPEVVSVTATPSFPANLATTDQVISSFDVHFTEELLASTVNVENGFIAYNPVTDHYYVLSDTQYTWHDAEAYATGLGGHLVSITDQAEQDFVSGWFSRYDPWIGLSDEALEGTWAWSSGEAFGYSNWQAGQPDNLPWPGGNWAYLSNLGTWYDQTNDSHWAVVELDAATTPDTDGDGVPDFMDVLPAAPLNTWDLREAGADATFDTPDDVIYNLDVAPYVDGTTVSFFVFDGPLDEGNYRFRVSNGVTDHADNMLDGDGNGTGGDAYVHFFTVALPDTYVLESRSNNSIGSATALSMTEDPALSGFHISQVGLGTQDRATYAGQWSDPDYWSFSGLAGDIVSASVDRMLYSTADFEVSLHNSTGSQLAADSSYGPGGDPLIGYYTLPSDGMYYVRVGKDWGSAVIGNYQVHVDLARGIQHESEDNYGNDTVGSADTLTLARVVHSRKATVAGTIMGPEGNNQDEDVFR